MNFKTLGLLAGLLFLLGSLHGCNFGTGPTGGGTGADGLTGILVDGGGKVVANAKVRVYPDSSTLLAKTAGAFAARRDSTVTDVRGRYNFSGLPAGRYNLTASYVRHDTTYAFFLGGIVYDGGKLDLGIDTAQAASELWVRVANAQEVPLAGAVCDIPGTPWRAVSDANGDCVLSGVAAGDLLVRVTASGMGTITTPVSARAGVSGAACQVYLAPEGSFSVPGDWALTSLEGYAYSIPPDLVLQSEAYGLDTWSARYEGPSLTVSLMSGMVPNRPFTEEFPEYTLESWTLDSNESNVKGAILITYRVPDSLKAQYPGTTYIAELWTTYSSPVTFIEPMRFAVALCETPQALATAKTILRSFRLWKGPGPAPVPPPFKPFLFSPRPVDTVSLNQSSAIRAIWRAARGSTLTTHYRVQVSASPTFGTLSQNDSVALSGGSLGPDSLSLNLNRPPAGSTSYWRVLAVGPGGSTPSDTRILYMTPPAPAKRSLLSPAVNDTGVSRTPVVSWGVILDAPTYENYFQVQISADSLFQNPVVNDVTDPFYDAKYNWRVSGTLAPTTRYFVRVVSVGAGGSTPSDSRAFTTGTVSFDPPVVPQLMSPAPQGTVSQSASTFSWMYANDGSTTTSYYLQVASDSLFKNLSVYDAVPRGNAQTGLTTWTLNFSVLTSGQSYFWRVIGIGPGGFTPSEARKVTVQ